MADITIDRLTLRLSGLSESDGQRLAARIAEGLAAAAPAGGRPRHMDALRVNVAAAPGDGVERIAAQVVADILRQIERTI